MSSSRSSAKQFQILLVSSNEKGFLVRSSFTFLNYLFINIAGCGCSASIPCLRTLGRTEEFTLTRPCVNLKKKKVSSKSSCQ